MLTEVASQESVQAETNIKRGVCVALMTQKFSAPH